MGFARTHPGGYCRKREHSISRAPDTAWCVMEHPISSLIFGIGLDAVVLGVFSYLYFRLRWSFLPYWLAGWTFMLLQWILHAANAAAPNYAPHEWLQIYFHIIGSVLILWGSAILWGMKRHHGWLGILLLFFFGWITVDWLLIPDLDTPRLGIGALALVLAGAYFLKVSRALLAQRMLAVFFLLWGITEIILGVIPSHARDIEIESSIQGTLFLALAMGQMIRAFDEIQTRLKSSELHHRTIFMNTPDGILLLRNSDLRVTSWNPRAIVLFGLSESIPPPLPLADLTDEANLNALRSALTQVLLSDQPTVCDVEMQRRGKTWLAEVSIDLVNRDESGGALFCLLFRDHTEHQEYEHKLREQQSFMESVIHAFSAVVMLVDERGRITDINRYGCDTFQATQTELLGTPFEELLAPLPGDSQALPVVLRNCLQDRIPKQVVEQDIHLRSGKRAIVNLQASPLTLADGRPGAMLVLYDVTEHTDAERRVNLEKAHLEALMRNAPLGLAVLDERGTLRYFNTGAERLTGYSADKVVGREVGLEWFFGAEDRLRIRQFLTNGHGLDSYVTSFKRPDGEERKVAISVSPLQNEQGHEDGYLVVVADASREQFLEKELLNTEKRYQVLVENLPVGILILRERRILFANPKFCLMVGCSAKDLEDREFLFWIHPEDKPRMSSRLNESRLIQSEEHEFQMHTEAGTSLDVRMGITPFVHHDEIALLCSVQDITEQIRLGRELKQMALTDHMTGCWNSRAFYNDLRPRLEAAQRERRSLCLLYIDIDNFKDYNDQYGHLEGDRILRRIGRVLRGSLEGPDQAYRYGGDEFAFILEGYDSAKAVELARRVQRQLEDLQKFRISLSIGVCMLRPDDSLHQFIRHADQAMYLAKRAGKSRIHVYVPPADTSQEVLTVALPRSRVFSRP